MRHPFLPISILASLGAIAALSGALAQPEMEARERSELVEATEPVADEPARRTATKSRSVGRTNAGRLLNGVPFRASPHVQVRTPSNAHGTQEMVDLLEWAAARVAARHPGAVMNVGSISRRRGGRMRPHRSHRVGRDADIGFYLRDASSGSPAVPPHFVAMNRAGKGSLRETDYAFDDERNWTLIEALMSQDVVPVQYIMVVVPLKERLLAEAARRGASPELIQRVTEAVGPRRSGRGRWARYGTHDSHFHIRIFCATDDRPRCRDNPPFWDWVSIEPPARPSMRRSRRRSAMRRSMRSMRSATRSAMSARSARASRGAMRRASASMQTMRRRRSPDSSMQQ